MCVVCIVWVGLNNIITMNPIKEISNLLNEKKRRLLLHMLEPYNFVKLDE